MQPIDYTIDVKSPFESALQGFQAGAGVNQVMQKQQQQQLALQQQQQMQRDLGSLATNPNPTGQDYAAIMTKYPQLSEHFKRSWDVLNGAQQQARLTRSSQVYAALQAGKPEIAAQLLHDHAAAMRNSGAEEDAKSNEDMAKWIELDPQSAKNTAGMMLASIMGPDKFAETFSKLGAEQRAADKAPADLAKAEADARKAGADATAAEAKAKYADQDALLELEQKGWNIKSLQADIDYKSQSSRIAAMNATISREGNDLKRQELQLKVDEAKSKLNTQVREKVVEAESAASSIDNMLNTIQRIKNHKGLDSVVGSIQGRMGSYVSDEGSDAIALIDTLGSQAFMAQIPAIKGTGALSNAEGEKLQSALQNLSRVQSEKQFRTNLEEASRLISKARTSVEKRYGVPLGNPDTPAAKAERPPLDSFRR